jgi:hypothetical protein
MNILGLFEPFLVVLVILVLILLVAWYFQNYPAIALIAMFLLIAWGASIFRRRDYLSSNKAVGLFGFLIVMAGISFLLTSPRG